MRGEPTNPEPVDRGVMTINTILSLPLVKAAGAAVFLVTAGWLANGYTNRTTESIAQLTREFASLRSELKVDLDRRTSDLWTRNDQRLWSYEFERANQTMKIVVPVPAVVPSSYR